MSPCTNESRSCAMTSARFSTLPAYVSASSVMTSYGVATRRWRMKFDEMNPAPPVTSTRFTDALLELLLDGVQRPAFDLALDSAQMLPDQREDEPLEAEHEEDEDAAEQRTGEVPLGDPEHGAVDPEGRRDDRAQNAERDAD